MTFQNAHLAVRLNGGFSSPVTPVDKWSCGVRVAIPGQDIRYDTGDLQTFANAVHTAARTLQGSASVLAGTNTYFTHVTVARIGENGRYEPADQLTTVSAGASQQGGGTPTQPWNTAHSFGLRTDAPRGYASNGRVYYPMLAPVVTATTGRLHTTAVAGRVAAFVTFLQAVNAAAAAYDLGAAVCVMSNVGAGTTRVVTAVRADERLDSIERRENDQVPVYTTTPL